MHYGATYAPYTNFYPYTLPLSYLSLPNLYLSCINSSAMHHSVPNAPHVSLINIHDTSNPSPSPYPPELQISTSHLPTSHPSKECKNYTCWPLGVFALYLHGVLIVCLKSGIWGWGSAPCMSNKK